MSNSLKKTTIVVVIIVIVITLLLGVAKQRDFFLPTLIIILSMIVWMAFLSGSMTILKLKGTTIMFVNDGIHGSLVSKPRPVGDGELEVLVSLPPGYTPARHKIKELSWSESFFSMIANTNIIKVKDLKTRFEYVPEALCPEGCIRYWGSLEGRVITSRLQSVEEERDQYFETITTLRTQLFKVKNELEKEAHMDIGSLDGARKFIQNVNEELNKPIHIIGPSGSSTTSGDKK